MQPWSSLVQQTRRPGCDARGRCYHSHRIPGRPACRSGVDLGCSRFASQRNIADSSAPAPEGIGGRWRRMKAHHWHESIGHLGPPTAASKPNIYSVCIGMNTANRSIYAASYRWTVTHSLPPLAPDVEGKNSNWAPPIFGPLGVSAAVGRMEQAGTNRRVSFPRFGVFHLESRSPAPANDHRRP